MMTRRRASAAREPVATLPSLWMLMSLAASLMASRQSPFSDSPQAGAKRASAFFSGNRQPSALWKASSCREVVNRLDMTPEDCAQEV